jgi:hypothetical protein
MCASWQQFVPCQRILVRQYQKNCAIAWWQPLGTKHFVSIAARRFFPIHLCADDVKSFHPFCEMHVYSQQAYLPVISFILAVILLLVMLSSLQFFDIEQFFWYCNTIEASLLSTRN